MATKGSGKTSSATTTSLGPQSSKIAQRRDQRREKAGKDDARLQEIMRAAYDLFSRVGYESASLEDIADNAGIDLSSLYYYFGSKAELLATVILQPLRRLYNEVEAATANERDPVAKLRAAIEAHLKCILCNYPGTEFLFAQRDISRFGEQGEMVWAEGLEYRRMFQRIVEGGQAAGVVRSDVDPYLATMAVLGMLNWVHRWFGPHDDLDELCRNFTTVALQGLCRSGIS